MTDSVHGTVRRLSTAKTHLEKFVHFVRSLPEGLVKEKLVEVEKTLRSDIEQEQREFDRALTTPSSATAAAATSSKSSTAETPPKAGTEEATSPPKPTTEDSSKAKGTAAAPARPHG